MSGQFIRGIFNWILYSNVLIGLCAWSMIQLTRSAFPELDVVPDYYDYSLLLGTLALYAFHRYFGIARIETKNLRGRFAVISKYRGHLLIYGLVCGLASSYLALQYLSVEFIFKLLPAGLIGVLYVAPVLGNQRRLRDFPYIKVFLIAIIWSWFTSFVLLEHFSNLSTAVIFSYGVERFLFVLAITLPFDIRDIEIDRLDGTETIPGRLGINSAKRIALISLLAAAGFLVILHNNGVLEVNYLLSAFITYFLAGLLIWRSSPNNHDYYYTGLMDGLMIINYVLFCFISFLK